MNIKITICHIILITIGSTGLHVSALCVQRQQPLHASHSLPSLTSKNSNGKKKNLHVAFELTHAGTSPSRAAIPATPTPLTPITLHISPSMTPPSLSYKNSSTLEITESPAFNGNQQSRSVPPTDTIISIPSRRTSTETEIGYPIEYNFDITEFPSRDVFIDEETKQQESLKEESRVRYLLQHVKRYSCSAIAGGLIELATGAMTLAYQDQLLEFSSLLFSPGGWHTPVASVVLTGSLLVSCYQFAPRRCYQKIISAKKMEYLPLLASKAALCITTNTAPLAYLTALLTNGGIGNAGSVLTIGGTLASTLGILGQRTAHRSLQK